MDEFELYNKLQELMYMLDGESYPELHDYLAEIMDEEEGVTEDLYEIANRMLLCDDGEDFNELVVNTIIELFEEAFKEGNPEAANDLGAQYYDGSRGFPQDYSKAVHYYNLAAEKGSRQAQGNLGYCYLYGRDMPVDYEKAFQYFALGAFDGHLVSLYKIGDMYAQGYYVQKNEEEAFHIYEHCVDMLTDESAPRVAGPVFLRLGKCFLYGLGVEKNPNSAMICYQKAEMFLYEMVKNGDYMYYKSMQAAIEGQAKAREILNQELWNQNQKQ